MAKKALVVDNDFFFVEFLSELLETKGYEVTKAYNGKEGISKLEKEVFDVLFADLIMPKIDGSQLIKFARGKSPSARMITIAVSDTLIEQMDDVKDIGADYCVVKGPFDKMTEYMNDLLDCLEDHGTSESGREKLVDPGNLYPRQTTAELVEELNFQRAVFDGIGLGVLVVDRDARVLCANAMALRLLDKPIEEVLNFRITDVFPQKGRGRLVKALKEVARNPGLKRRAVYLASGVGALKVVTSMLRIGDEPDGWILTIEDMES